MPIRSREDAADVERHVARIFDASPSERAGELRTLFVEALDFDAAFGPAPLDGAAAGAALPHAAERIAHSDGVHVVYVALDTDRVRKGEASAAAKRIADDLGEDLLLVFTNTSASQLHLVYPSFEGVQPSLRRMVVERDLPRRTVVQQVSNIYWNRRDAGNVHLALDQAFDVEPVTNAFFQAYQRVFDATERRVAGFGDDAEAKRRFVQTLFNRLMFVYFLSRKGWLAFNGDKDYLNALWRDYRAAEGQRKNFYVDRLRPLFFAGLNNYRSEDVTDEPEAHRLIGSVPFLNGGLFDMTDDDCRTGLVVPDQAIQPILTDLFDRFNFTVMESTPLDVEVAVDPEMLGKVFEELVTGRHDSGAYYTPRPVVSFMCREALKGYLEGQDTGLAPEAIARFVDHRDTAGVSVASAPGVARALDQVTVVDPACGSGAYLLGMMQELVELQTALFNVGVDEKGLYDLKLHVIQRNLYGVDIDDFAVNIAMLRLWLSLAIEYEGDPPPPLPNLDFKVLHGDSLLGPDPSADVVVQGTLGYDIERVRQLGRLKADFMRASQGPDKDRLRAGIQKAEDDVREALGAGGLKANVIDWRVSFVEVFATRGGFDIAIANPPYVNMVAMEKSAPDYRERLRENFVTARGGFDIFVPFVERGLQVLSGNGLQAYITPNKLLAAEYAKTLRDYVLSKAQLLSVADFSDASPFGAAVYPVVTVVSKPSRCQENSTVDIFRTTGATTDLHQVVLRYSAPLAVARRLGNLWSPLLVSGAKDLLPILESCDRLGDLAAVSASATVDEAYKWKEAVLDNGASLHSGDPDRYRPFIVSGNIRRFAHTWGKKPTQYIKRKYYSPVIDTSHSKVKNQRVNQIRAQKLIISGMSKRITCVYDRQGIAAGTSTVLVIGRTPMENAFICGLLNSDFMQRIYTVMFGSLSLAGGFLRYGSPQIRELPIPKVSAAEQRPFVALVDRILAAKAADPSADTSALEAEVDRLVYALYGLTPPEIAAVGG